ncbi:MAG: polymer-forming cytoskeletal protein [Candidatus Saganbacteria bacterium]|nr:polymer-forming cytoskeletal protein [Candidatus Saganbacteria bacterium]
MFDAKQGAGQGMIGSIIGEDTTVKGEIKTTGSFRLDGTLEGNVNSAAEVYISAKGTVHGNVEGKNVIVAGQVKGNVASKESVEIKKNGKIFGDISGNRLSVDEGASYRGKVTMGEVKEFAGEEIKEDTFSDKVKEIIGL